VGRFIVAQEESNMLLLLALFVQAQVQLRVNLPDVRFDVAPPMVEVSPGVLVVHDYDQEVFFVDGRYWMRWRDGRWYRANDHRGGWVSTEPRAVPGPLARLPPGTYRHYKARPEKFRVANGDGSVTEYKVKEKHGVTEVKVKEKKEKKEKKAKWK
jgi:hypothetical protein